MQKADCCALTKLNLYNTHIGVCGKVFKLGLNMPILYMADRPARHHLMAFLDNFMCPALLRNSLDF